MHRHFLWPSLCAGDRQEGISGDCLLLRGGGLYDIPPMCGMMRTGYFLQLQRWRRLERFLAFPSRYPILGAWEALGRWKNCSGRWQATGRMVLTLPATAIPILHFATRIGSYHL